MAKKYEVILRISTSGPAREYRRVMTVQAEEDVTFSLLLDRWMSGEFHPEDGNRVKCNIPQVAYSARTMIWEVESAKAPDGRDVRAIAKEALE